MSDSDIKKLLNGQILKTTFENANYKLYDNSGKFFGVGQVADGFIKLTLRF